MIVIFHLFLLGWTSLTDGYYSLFRYEDPLSPLGQHISNEFGLTKRHFFEFPSPHCNVDLDEYEYEGDFE